MLASAATWSRRSPGGPAWLLTRTVNESADLGGFAMPQGSTVVFSPFVIHRDPVVYPEPARFDPYRWSTEQRASILRHAYQPLGGGARQCIGENFAWSEMTVILAEITKRWTLVSESGVVPRMMPRGDDPPGPDRHDSPHALRRLGEGGTVTAPTRLTVPPLYCPLPSAMQPDAVEIGPQYRLARRTRPVRPGGVREEIEPTATAAVRRHLSQLDHLSGATWNGAYGCPDTTTAERPSR
ncbi:cytochrome P450 [Streptomyces sp. NPDC005706]|uniref:cytochrome P450 n=1 Tax=Streptomyces sp. NPDC005706 TaxID=3157169 RepID=UPI0033CAC654